MARPGSTSTGSISSRRGAREGAGAAALALREDGGAVRIKGRSNSTVGLVRSDPAARPEDAAPVLVDGGVYYLTRQPWKLAALSPREAT